jgi:hypothetical protein
MSNMITVMTVESNKDLSNVVCVLRYHGCYSLGVCRCPSDGQRATLVKVDLRIDN